MNQPSRGLDGSEMHPLQIWTDQVTKTMKQLIQEGSPEQARTSPNNARTTAGFQKKNIRKTIKTGKNPSKPEQGPNTEEVYEPCVLLWEAKMKEMPHEKC